MSMKDALDYTDWLIADLKKAGKGDYTKHRETLAVQVLDEGHWQGNNDITTDLGDPELPDLRIIQEDEWDQSMEEDEDRPTWESMICSGAYGYCWIE